MPNHRNRQRHPTTPQKSKEVASPKPAPAPETKNIVKEKVKAAEKKQQQKKPGLSLVPASPPIVPDVDGGEK